jgi:hypothetical protein
MGIGARHHVARRRLGTTGKAVITDSYWEMYVEREVRARVRLTGTHRTPDPDRSLATVLFTPGPAAELAHQ